MPTQQIETATIVGTIVTPGNAKITVTSARISTNPTVLSVAVAGADDASAVALKCRTAIALNSTISDVFQVSGSGANIVLTERVANANDATLNIASANDTCTGLTAEPTSTHTQAGDGLSNCYITLAQLKATNELNISDASFDSPLTDVINAVCRVIDQTCNRRFWKNSVDETRYYTPSQDDQCRTHDIVSLTSLATDTSLDRTYATVWAATDYDLYPYNAVLNGEPYWRIDTAPNGKNTFGSSPTWGGWARTHTPRFVKVVGIFGWATVPPEVKQAALLWSMRTWMRHSTVLGVSGAGPFGQMMVNVPPADPDVMNLLQNYILEVTGVL